MKHLRNILIIFAAILLLTACHNHKEAGEQIVIFHAGSLAMPLKTLTQEFNKENPKVKVFAESSGSLDAARKVTDLNKDCDILAVADFLVIDKLLIPEFASWNFVFASNEMVIAYTDKSIDADKITADNWQNILMKDNIVIGRSDPNADPCGYRTVFLFELAELFYQQAGLKGNLLEKKNTVIRPKEVDLLALLETGNIDYLMIYRSVAIQHKLKYIELPDEINLSNPQFEDFYNSVSLEVNGKEQGATTTINGSSILYSLTIPKNSKNFENALKFILFLTDAEKGGKILSDQGMGVVNYCDKKYLEKLPDELSNIVK